MGKNAIRVNFNNVRTSHEEKKGGIQDNKLTIEAENEYTKNSLAVNKAARKTFRDTIETKLDSFTKVLDADVKEQRASWAERYGRHLYGLTGLKTQISSFKRDVVSDDTGPAILATM